MGAGLARMLEEGALRGPASRALSALYGLVASRGVARPVALPRGARVIGVGSAVLGGAGKTPIAIAITRALVARGERAALIGHGYRARPGEARVVRPSDRVDVVGDDALACARALDSVAPVIVAPSRTEALAFAASRGVRVLIADGLLQARPARVAHAILVLDAMAPWGAGACPPAGDLRAPRDALLALVDHVVAIGRGSVDVPAISLASTIVNAVDDRGHATPLADVARQRVGVALAVARPGRVLASLAAAGVAPAEVVLRGDHEAFPMRLFDRARADVWLTTARCAVKLPASIHGAPVLAIEHAVDAAPLVDAIDGGRSISP